jgi:AsmA protein
MRKLIAAVGVLIVLIIVALLLIPKLINVEQYRPKIQAELQQRLGRQVSFGAMHLSLLPLAIQIDNAAISEDPHFGSGQFATVQRLDVHAKLLPLLRKDVQISSVVLKQPKIELIRNTDGVWNFSSIGQQPNQPSSPTAGANAPASKSNRPQQQAQKPPAEKPAQPSEPKQQQNFALDHLSISDGTVAFTDMQKHQSRAVYDHIDVDLKNFAPDKQFTIAAAAHLPGQGSQVVKLDGNVGPIKDGAMLETPFDGNLKLDHVSLSAAQKFLNTQALANTDANITGETNLKNQNGNVRADGNLTLNDAKVHGVEIGYPIVADYNLSDDLKNDTIQISKMNLKLGSTPFNLTGTVNTKPTPALLDVKLNASDVSIAEASRLASAFGVAFNPGMDVSGNVSADVHAQGATDKPVLNGNLSAKNLNVSGKDLPAPVKVPAITLALSPQAIQSNDFTATAGSTNVAMKFTLTQYATPSPSIDATVHTANANVAELLNMAKASGVSAANGMSGSGSLNLDVHATGPIKQTDRMTFVGRGKLENAALKPASFTQPLQVKNADLTFSSNSATLNNLAASLGSSHIGGTATVKNFNAPNVQFNLTGDQVNVTELQQITGSQTQPAQQQPQKKRASLIPAAEAAAPAKPAAPAKSAPSSEPSILTKMTGGGTLQVGKIINDKLVLNNVRTNVALNNGIIKLAPITAGLYGGQLNGTITADARPTPMAVTVATKLNNVDANQLLSSVSSVKDTIYGLLASSGNLSFAATDANDIARTLNGNLSLNLLNGKITKMDLLNELSSIGKFAGFSSGNQKVTNVAKLSGGFDIRNGVATTNNLQAAIDGGTMAATGSVNLADQSLNMHVTAILSKAFSDKVGGQNIGGFMNTALANNKGELVMPVIVTGTFDNPHFEPDVQQIAQMKLKNLLPTSGNPGQLTNGLLGGILGGNKGTQAQGQGGVSGILGALGGQKNNQQNAKQQQQQPGNAVSEALGGLLGGKKKQQNQQQQPPPK